MKIEVMSVYNKYLLKHKKGVKYVFLSLRRQLRCLAEAKKLDWARHLFRLWHFTLYCELSLLRLREFP
jgi:hypothetical protein